MELLAAEAPGGLSARREVRMIARRSVMNDSTDQGSAGMHGREGTPRSFGTNGPVHVPVLVPEVLAALDGAKDAPPLAGWVVDGTLGAGGHTRAILEAFPDVRVLGVDQDPDALGEARAQLANFEARVELRRGRISQIPELCAALEIEQVSGMLFDLGANSLHFDRAERGFSLMADGPLDMRMDPARERTAADIVNRWDEADLADLFYYEGGEHRSRPIARALVQARRRAPFLRTLALAELIARTVGGGGRVHPATKVFQALRRAVNEEGEELERGLAAAEALLADGGRLAVLTFHSGEDGMVKRYLAEGARAGRFELESKKPVAPTNAEVRANPRARSARLRAAVRTRSDARSDARSRGVDSRDASRFSSRPDPGAEQ